MRFRLQGAPPATEVEHGMRLWWPNCPRLMQHVAVMLLESIKAKRMVLLLTSWHWQIAFLRISTIYPRIPAGNIPVTHKIAIVLADAVNSDGWLVRQRSVAWMPQILQVNSSNTYFMRNLSHCKQLSTFDQMIKGSLWLYLSQKQLVAHDKCVKTI